MAKFYRIDTLIENGVLVEDEDNVFEPSRDWKIYFNGYEIYHAEREDKETPHGPGHQFAVTREGKYEGHPVITTVQSYESMDYELFQRVDPDF